MVNDTEYASDNDHHAECPGIGHGDWKDFYIITDYTFNLSHSEIMANPANSNDHFSHNQYFYMEQLYTNLNAMKSQIELYDQCEEYPCFTKVNPTFEQYRGMECFNGLPFFWTHTMDQNCPEVPDIDINPEDSDL